MQLSVAAVVTTESLPVLLEPRVMSSSEASLSRHDTLIGARTSKLELLSLILFCLFCKKVTCSPLLPLFSCVLLCRHWWDGQLVCFGEKGVGVRESNGKPLTQA